MKIIVWEDKHGTSLYDASTLEVWAESSIEILRTMMDNGYYYLDEYTGEPPLTDGQIDALPDQYKETARRDQAAAIRRIKETKENNDFYREVERVIREHDTGSFTLGSRGREREIPIAWDLLDQRSDYEYEHVSVETVWQPKSD